MTDGLTVADAARHVRVCDRILVIGCSGGGKSTLSRKLAAKFGLAYQSLDRDVRWLPGWVERDKPEQRRITTDLVRVTDG